MLAAGLLLFAAAVGTAFFLLRPSGVDPDKVEVAQFNATGIGDMLKDASLDAFVVVRPIESKLLSEAIVGTARLRGEPTFLPVDVSEAIAARHPLYESGEIPGGAITTSPARPADKLETIGVNHLIVAPKSLSETPIGTLTRQIFTAKPQLVREVAAASRIEKPDTDKDAALPAHPGAAAYIDGTERSFMDKYSDYVWGVVLSFSVLGSATAALRHFIRRDERKLNTLHREKLVDAIAKARRIDTMEQLDALQTRSCARHSIATTTAPSTNPILQPTISCWSSFITRSSTAATHLAGRTSTFPACARDDFSPCYCPARHPGRSNNAARPQGEVSILSPS